MRNVYTNLDTDPNVVIDRPGPARIVVMRPYSGFAPYNI